MPPKTRPVPNSTIEKAIDALASAGVDIGANERATDVQVPDKDVLFEPDVNIEELPDGGADINFDPNAPIDQSQIKFGDNLAEYIEENDLLTLSNKLVAAYESDKMSRKDWEDTYVKGLDMLGFKYEDRTQPFEGAAGDEGI